MAKLTKAQRDLLEEAALEGGTSCVEGYRPRQRLIELGLAEVRSARYDNYIVATPAGRAALVNAEKSEGDRG